MGKRSRQVLAFDTRVKLTRPWLDALTCLLTGGLAGAVLYAKATTRMREFGRRRGQMPFAFIAVNGTAATLLWLLSLVAWYGALAALVAYGVHLHHGDDPVADDITTVSSSLLLFAPLAFCWSACLDRVRTAQHLAGVARVCAHPVRWALAATILPPLGTWKVSRELNRAWREYLS